MADPSPKVPIIVAIVGLVGVLGAAVISNWDKLTRSGQGQGSTTSTASTTTVSSGQPQGAKDGGSTGPGADRHGSDSVATARRPDACDPPFDRISPNPDDQILDFHVVRIQGREFAIKADYRISPSHERVMIGAHLKGSVGSGYRITFTPPLVDGRGAAELEMRVNEAGQSDRIEIFLYEQGRPSEPFACRIFPYRMRFD